jgi:hypothetical protein
MVMFSVGDFLVPADVRVALYAVLANEPELTAQSVFFDGRVLYAIGRTEQERRQELRLEKRLPPSRRRGLTRVPRLVRGTWRGTDRPYWLHADSFPRPPDRH